MSYSPLTPLLLLPYSTLAMIRGDKGWEKTKYPHAHHHVFGCWTAGVPPAQKRPPISPPKKMDRRHPAGTKKDYRLPVGTKTIP